MANELLLDTGAFVALISSSEKSHADCVAVLEDWSGVIVTTEAVVTETIYLLGPRWRAQKVALEFLRRRAFLLMPSSHAVLERVSMLMEKYQDVPMDYADATLVALGEELGSNQVFTLDRRGFSTYRLHARKSFQIVP